MASLKNQSSLKRKVFEVVKKIPRGKVATYGQIAAILSQSQSVGSKSVFLPRLVGFCLHQNKDLEVPCHRVVDRNGRLASNFAFSAKGGPASGGDGWKEQRRRLEAEGVKFADEKHVDLATCVWQGNPKF